MTRLRVALRVPVGRPLPDIAAFVARCEDAGFDGVGIHDHPSSGRDAYLALALAARATHRLRLFPATSSPVVRHPLVLASLAHSLEEIAPGRICLTVAPGFISTRSIGQPRARVAFMRDAIRDLRRLLAGEEVAFGPTSTRLRNRSTTPTPVYLLAAGPTHDRTRGRGGRWRVSHGRPASGFHPRRVASPGGRGRAGRPLAGRVPGGVRGHARSRTRCRGGSAMGAELVRAGTAFPRLSECRESSLVAGKPASTLRKRTIPPPSPRNARTRLPMHLDCSAQPERCAERLLRAREEAGVEDVFLFPAHDLAGGYDMPEAEVQAFERIIRPRLGG